MTTPQATSLEGGCDCGHIRYRLLDTPLFVHCCHCRWCQRETGASYALNALIESEYVAVLDGEPTLIETPTAGPYPQQIARCPHCWVAVWSHYAGSGPHLCFVRVGTLDEPDRLTPDIHIFTDSKQPWVILPEGVPALPEYYDRRHHWPETSLVRWQALKPRIDEYRQQQRGRPT